MFVTSILPWLLATAPMPPAPPLPLEQQTALRCAAAFALVSAAQTRGDPDALALPPLGQRGREYFVRVSAQIMDQYGLTRDQVAGMLGLEAHTLVRSGQSLDAARPCLVLLDAAGL